MASQLPERLIARSALASALFAGAASAQDIQFVSSTALEVPAPQGATHELHLAAYLFAGTRWEAAQVRKALPAAAALLAQCGIAVAIDLHVLRAPRRFHILFTPDSRELLRELKVSRPAVFFVDDTRNLPAYDAEAVGRGNSRTRPEMTNTVWVTFGTPDLPVAIAHEVTHVLTDSGGHVPEVGNLMHPRTAPGNIHLAESQCDTLRTRGETGGLIRPRMVKP